jgi:hypothetical protein
MEPLMTSKANFSSPKQYARYSAGAMSACGDLLPHPAAATNGENGAHSGRPDLQSQSGASRWRRSRRMTVPSYK